MSKLLAYRALMPSHYTPRRTKTGAPVIDQDGSRKWFATRLPALRLFGPFWSFGFQVHETPKNTLWPTTDAPALRGLRALTEAQVATANPNLEKAHYPTLLGASLRTFLQVSAEPKGKPGKFNFWESRMSLLAVRSINPGNIDDNGQLTKFDPSDFPVVNGTAVDGSPTVIVAPFGDPQPQPETTFKEDNSGNPKVAAAIAEQHLPAMQLLHGRVRFTAGSGYLKAIRKVLKLSPPPKEIAQGDTIVLLPDGFALAGAVELPWMGKDPVAGWFKVCFRWLDPEKDRAIIDQLVVDNPPQPVLRPWLDEEMGGAQSRSSWRDVIDRLEGLLRHASGQDTAPRWLDLRPNVSLSADDIFWPLAYDGKKGEPSILVERPQRDIVIIDGAGLLARLSDRPLAEGPISTLTVEPEAFVVKSVGESKFTIETEQKLSPGKDVVFAAYSYTAPSDQVAEAAETMSIDTLDPNGKPIGSVELAVPMIETAERLRQAMGLPLPVQKTDDAPKLPPLWVFTPLDEGWLHWPLPNATLGILSRLADGAAPSADEPSAGGDAGDGISGAILFGNQPGNPGFRRDHRPWSVSMGEPRQGDLSVTVEILSDDARFSSAAVNLRGFTLSLDGMVPITAFRQTSERLLPDHAERALATSGLRAVSPSSLNKIERDLRNKVGAPRFSLSAGALTINRGLASSKTSTETQNHIDGNISWSLSDPAATDAERPWIWVRHRTLPTVQNMPMAVAGKARNLASEAYSLAPFVYSGSATNLTYACVGGTLDMSRLTITLDANVNGSVGAGAFRRPFGAGDKDWPWREEIGMAVTTMPSLTLFPGQKVSGSLAAPTPWSSYNAPDGVAVVARHDIALRDQFHALSVAPVKPQPGADETPPLAVFRPRIDNGPTGTGETNGYDLVWTELSRKLGLAALDRRDMLRIDDKGTWLTGVFGEIHYAVATTSFNFEINLESVKVRQGRAVKTIPVAVTSLGDWSLQRIQGLEAGSLKFPGLPQDGDLSGVSGRFLRRDKKIDVRYGTAILTSDKNIFVDQFGTETWRPDAPASDSNGSIIKPIVIHPTERTETLLTLVKPVAIAGEDDLAFWCADVPVDRDKKSFLRTYANEHLQRMNGGSLDTNPLAGFRWTLAGRLRPAETVVIKGFVFEPLVLAGAAIDAKTQALSRVEIQGRLLLPVGDQLVLPRAGGSATLVLSAAGDGTLVPEFTDAKIVWPLVDPQTAAGVVPTLTFEGLPAANKTKTGTLNFGFAGTVFSVPVEVSGPSSATELLVAKLEGGPTNRGPWGEIATKRLVVSIGRARMGDDGLDLQKRHSAMLTIDTHIGPPEASVAATLTHDLLLSHEQDSLAAPTFTGPAQTTFEVEADGEGAFAYGADHLAFRWRLRAETQQKPRPPLLDGFSVAKGSGSFFATLSVDTTPPALILLPSIQIVGLEEEAAFDLSSWFADDTYSAQLQLVRRRQSRDQTAQYRFYGTLDVRNAFSWPSLSVAPSSNGHFEEATLQAGDTDRIHHTAVVAFQADILAADGEGGFFVTGRVNHTVEKENTSWTWEAHQSVRLMPRACFATHLAKLVPPKSKVPAELQKSDVGFSPLVGSSGAPLTDYTAVPHFLHLAASGPGGISGPLAEGLLKTMKANAQSFLVVDLSSHLMLNFRSSAAPPLVDPLILSSLPAICFCLPKEGKLPWSEASPVLDMLATNVTGDTPILQSITDGIGARSLAVLERAISDRVVARAAGAISRADMSAATVLLAHEANEAAHRTVFQAVVLRKNKETWQPAWDLPGAATAMHLSALLDTSLRDIHPAVVGFRPFGGITGNDLFKPEENPKKHPLLEATEIDPGQYNLAMQRFRKRLVRDLVGGPAVAASTISPAGGVSVSLRLVARARDGDGQRVIVEQQDIIDRAKLDAVLDGIDDWGRQCLERLAPWAGAGFAQIFLIEAGTVTEIAVILRIEKTETRAIIDSQSIEPVDTPAQRQLEQVSRHYAGEARAITGYSPMATEPRLFTSEPAWTYGEDEPNFRLTATGVSTAWSLVGGSGATLGTVPGSDTPSAFWITDRHRAAFRPFDPNGREINSALPEPFGAQLPGSLLPANHALPTFPREHQSADDDDALPQSFAPAVVTSSRVSSRSGAFATTRTGLISIVEDGQTVSVLEASQTPVSTRQPRPPILARNDRARASSHEPQPLYVSRNPTAIVHGPRVGPMGANNLPVGLDRRPRSMFAGRLVLVSPSAGIATPDWNGVFTLTMDSVFGTADDPSWSVESAAVVIGNDRYSWQAVDAAFKGADSSVDLADFRGSAGGTGTVQSVLDALRAAAPASRAVLEITLSYQRDEGGALLRQVRFELLSAGQGVAVPGVEAPLCFRFDDPEYNDQLNGLAKVARENSPAAPTDDFVFAADFADIRPDQRLELALALRPTISGAPVSKKFGSSGGHLTYDDVLVEMTFERQRAGNVNSTPLGVLDGGIDNAERAETWGTFYLKSGTSGMVFHAIRLDCSLLSETINRTGSPALVPEDQLQITIRSKGSNLPLVVLRFDIVAQPDMPSNQSTFGILMLKPAERSAPVHLFAPGPDATVMELVDPLDLVEGVVRRRAIFQWRSFYRAIELLGGSNVSDRVRFALQKTNGSGGTWLPSRFDDGWLDAPDQ
ncbi:hypothetical protein GFL95_32020 [Rhizobium leguminosarum bv. viciae]|uniref:hypothetical protein n=1 Tax=Rhizobium leguminosarum TaxID=384 RepID=UPI00144298DA|nr:hypothetical protein [Rhizobium leguminosarum]NKK95782.1 hypothetical protein [Rhizobium leguminosarum bv. viciae]